MRPRKRGSAIVALAGMAGLALLCGCGVSPDDPDAGELTAVVTSRGDSFVPFDGGPLDTYARVVVLTEDELLAARARSFPGQETPEPHEFAYLVVRIPVDDLVPLEVGGQPADTQALAVVSDGRLRIPWSGERKFLCLGTEYRGVVKTMGCAVVDRPAPAAVTLAVHIGGLGIED